MSPDPTALEAETLRLLQRLIQFNTTNPPGNERPLAEFLQQTFEAAGIPTELLEPAPGRANLFARIRGDGSERPILLLAHSDVVGVEEKSWSCDPFGGLVRDGYLYGRGAIDDKGMLAANAAVMLQLKGEIDKGTVAALRDIIFLATADEEAGGSFGMEWLVENHRDLLDVEFALNEGGRTRVIAGGTRYLAVQSAEKISYEVRLSANGRAGHAAVPLEDNAIFALSRALARLSAHIEPVCLTPITLGFFEGLAPIWPDAEVAAAMRSLKSEDAGRVDSAARVLSTIPVFNAVLRAGISPTILKAGIRVNVLPAEAGAMLNVRTVPGQSIESVIERIRVAIDDPEVAIEITERGAEAPPSDPGSALFRAIADAARALDSSMTVVPYLSTGVTDSARLRRLGVNAYGILPFPMQQTDEERMHGHDERVPVESLGFGARLIYGAVVRIALRGL